MGTRTVFGFFAQPRSFLTFSTSSRLVPRSIHKERSYIRYTALAQVEGIVRQVSLTLFFNFSTLILLQPDQNVPSLECRSVFRVSESFNPKLIGQPAREVSVRLQRAEDSIGFPLPPLLLHLIMLFSHRLHLLVASELSV